MRQDQELPGQDMEEISRNNDVTINSIGSNINIISNKIKIKKNSVIMFMVKLMLEKHKA